MPKVSKQLYFIAIILPPPVNEQIQELRLHVSRRYQSSHALKSPPHITLLAPFHMDENKEAELSSLLNGFSSQFQPFEIVMQDFGSFSNKVLFVHVLRSEYLKNVQHQLEKLARKYPKIFHYNYKKREFHPHITLAFRDLNEKLFQEAWKVYKNQKFRHSFLVTSFSLLKHDGVEWQVTDQFNFADALQETK